MPEQNPDVVKDIDFDMAMDFLIRARIAHEQNDKKTFIANRYLCLLNLGINSDVLPPQAG